jgi:glycosyltransferase involved in cell wall biosynthesis
MVVQSYYLRDPRVRREAEALAAEGYEVDVICLRDKGDPRREVVKGVNILRVPLGRRRATPTRYMFEYAFFFCATALVLLGRLFTRRYDLIHVNNMPDFLVFATLLPKLFGSKVILDVHDPMPELFMSKYGIGSDSRFIRLLAWQERVSLRYCHRALTVSDVMKDRLEQVKGCPPVTSVLNVPDETLLLRPEKWDRTEGTFALLYTGTISARYGLGIAIEACAKLRDRIPGLKLRLVGEGDDLPVLRETAERLGVADIVEFHPPVPLARIPEIVATCDVGISPHVDDIFMKLYFSTKVAEFVYMGLPTVVSRTQTIERHFDEDTVLYCEPGSVDSFTEAVLRLYEQPDLRARLAARCEEFSSRWTWGSEKHVYLDFVAGLIGKSAAERCECREAHGHPCHPEPDSGSGRDAESSSA